MRMEQRQLLTPRMIQSMEILQLPLMALEERIEQELQNNPVLEIREGEPDADAGDRTPPRAPKPARNRSEDEQALVVKENRPGRGFRPPGQDQRISRKRGIRHQHRHELPPGRPATTASATKSSTR